jgi:hypothetical protein
LGSIGGGGSMIPYAGNFGGFMPYRMGGGTGGLYFSPRNASVIGAGRAPFRLSPSSGGMPMTAGGMGQGFMAGRRAGGSLGLRGGMGFGGESRAPMDSDGSNVMPPYFGYPFYQPPEWLSSPASAAGMSSMR